MTFELDRIFLDLGDLGRQSATIFGSVTESDFGRLDPKISRIIIHVPGIGGEVHFVEVPVNFVCRAAQVTIEEKLEDAYHGNTQGPFAASDEFERGA